MRAYSGFALTVLLLVMLALIELYLGRPAVILAGTLAVLWFGIAFVLLSRPPGIPEFVSERPGSDEQYVVRRDVVPIVPLADRFRLSLVVACGSCLLIWLTLGLLAR